VPTDNTYGSGWNSIQHYFSWTTWIIVIFMSFQLFLLMLETDVHRYEGGAVVCNSTLGKKKVQSKLILSKYLRVSFRDNALYCIWLWPRHTKSCPQWLPTPENHKNINSDQKFTPGSCHSFCTWTAANESQAWEWFMRTMTFKNVFTVCSKHVGSNVNHHHTFVILLYFLAPAT
jgi:hypothetical protein